MAGDDPPPQEVRSKKAEERRVRSQVARSVFTLERCAVRVVL